VVVDSGSAASHAAIVAREYGIPAVMATVDGTRRLADGQVVRVDGSAGSVVRGRSGEIASEADSIV
jgi:pyruvate,water dikinase